MQGGGDLATGTVHRLWSAKLPVLVLETDRPASIRRQVSISEAIYDGQASVEGMEGIRIKNAQEADQAIADGKVPVLADPQGETIGRLRPPVVVDAIARIQKEDGSPYTVRATIPVKGDWTIVLRFQIRRDASRGASWKQSFLFWGSNDG